MNYLESDRMQNVTLQSGLNIGNPFQAVEKKIKHMSVAFGESDLQNSNAPELGDFIGYIQDIGV